MTNEDIAKLVADFIYKPSTKEEDFAIQLLVEKLCIPKDIKSYDQYDAYKNVLWHLNASDELI